MSEKKFHIVSLGCAKNTVDSDSMAQMLQKAGYKSVSNQQHADIIIVNTCGFIDAAREESRSVLAELAQKKRTGQVLIASGCMSQLCGSELESEIPGIDGFIGTRRWMDIVDLVNSLTGVSKPRKLYNLSGALEPEENVRRVSVQGASAYLKIADGCRRPCAFCSIPLIKGTAVSRPIASIVSEAKYLQQTGVKEIILIAQDTTDYGYDLGIKNGLAKLLTEMTASVPDIKWIRIMYAYPGCVTEELIEVMARHKQIVPYLDIPLQHAHPTVLRRMGRPSNMKWVYETINKMRALIPGLALRTTFIVGYPGETERQFQTLLDFIEEIRFDRVGAFKFSFEPGTASEPLGDPIPDDVKEERLGRLMVKQQQISLEINRQFIGRNLDVLIEGTKKDISIGRSYRDAPEIDGIVLVKGKFEPGQMIKVNIDKAAIYDLSGHKITE
jgi:ribosomal protein S12 methylthiotransferase